MAGSASASSSTPRTAVLWSALQPVLAASADPLDVVDIGGGTGGLAVRVAGLGHRVTVVDPSPDALAALDRRAREQDVTVTGRQGDLSSLLDMVGTDSADLVLCHGVLEVVDDPAVALATIARTLRPGGVLSLLVAQRHAAVVARAMAGHFQQALSLLEQPTLDQSGARHRDPGAWGRSGRRFVNEELRGLVEAAGFTTDSVSGVRVFADLVPGSLLDLEPGSTAALVELEQAVAALPEYLPLATQLHLLAHSSS
jgi:S-adenosylmethionine-dependent methyltransferase